MILITGATGKVGTDLVGALVEQGVPVRALVRDPQKAARQLPQVVELSRGDLGDSESVKEALDGAERMFLLSPPDPRMLELERTAIAAARDAGVKHLVKLSAVGADPASRSFFLREHGQAEQAARESGIPFTFLRPNFFIQNLLGVAGTVKAQGAIYQPGGTQAASHVDTHDIAAVAARVLTSATGHEGKTYTPTGPESLTFAQVAEIFSRVLGKPVTYHDVPRDAAKSAMVGAGMPEWQAEAISQLMDDYRDGKMSAVTHDVEQVTGRSPRSVEQFIVENKSAFM